MGRKNKCKPRIIPQQDKTICGCICFCQLVVVLSCVSLIYLTVAIYMPAYRAFRSGFEEKPVMCQTTNTSMSNNCSWASCGEWCLTRTSGFCPQIHSTVRQNGTSVKFVNCTTFSTSICPPIEYKSLKKYNCNNGTECAILKGIFNCSLGHCLNLSQIYDFQDCHYKADGFTVDSDKDNAKLNGYFECKGSKCTKIKKVFSCDRICKDNIISQLRNVFISVEDSIHQAYCDLALASNRAQGRLEGEAIAPTQFWTKQPDEVIMVSCLTVQHNKTDGSILGTDCINGTIYRSDDIPQPFVTFRQFWNLTGKYNHVVDPKNEFVPSQASLTIYNHSRLYINLDGCVNTLKGECQKFLQSHGKDGKLKTARSRYPCYYNKNNSFMAIARYDLKKTWRDLIIAIVIPSVLFIISFITLCAIMQSVRVDDDAKMRWKYCFSGPRSDNNCDLTEMISRNEISSPESDGPSFHRRYHQEIT
ncbi:uncharacterized protein LOC126748804 [Anthonomus grandis grandis]|uniref:uncharacterized protein LOC126748804 n=1 Tax=Anthonomus grandis grandis TaxID=2921223 RepID=UPI0021654011|nr:uncharacterized protein LOC126748804 [Anthonomus grandis grandis]